MSKNILRVLWSVLLSAIFAGNTINGLLNLYRLGSIGVGFTRRHMMLVIGVVVSILLCVGFGLYFHYFTVDSLVVPIVRAVVPVSSPDGEVEVPLNNAAMRR